MIDPTVRSRAHAVLAAAALCLTLACRDRGRQASNDTSAARVASPTGDTSAAPPTTASAPGATDGAGDAWYLNPEEGCEFDTTVAHPDPERLIAEYLERDAAGQFLQTDTWFNGATECPGHEPGPDGFVVADRYRSAPLSRARDTVRVVVTSEASGDMVASEFRANPRTIVDTVTAIRTRYGWRIASPALRQFVSRAAADSVNAARR